MKKIFIPLMMVLLVSCSDHRGPSGEPVEKEIFKPVETVTGYYSVVYDTETGVEYVSTSCGNFNVLVDSTGKPKIYEGWGTRH